MTGHIKSLRFDHGYGFIRGIDGVDYFFHRTGCIDMTEFDLLHHADRVEFEPVSAERGPRANDVRRA